MKTSKELAEESARKCENAYICGYSRTIYESIEDNIPLEALIEVAKEASRHNCRYQSLTRTDAIREGREPCGICNVLSTLKQQLPDL